ncbi:plsB Glycerol-3-phosphate acyltransferase [Candida maltosa Xu316]
MSTTKDISNSDFDVNILEDPLVDPNVTLKFPLPIDKETYIDVADNVKTVRQSFNILNSAFRLIAGGTVYDKIYSVPEYRYFTNKHSDEFRKKFKDYMNNKLEKDDTKLDEIIYDLINQELNLKLIKASQFKERFQAVKKYMVEFYKQQNEKNLPTFPSHNFVRSAYVTVMTVMSKLFPKGVWVSNNDISRLYKQYLDDPMSIIFLPSHQSHLDYIILHLICVRFQMATPAVIAGENLNVTVLGGLLKNLGAIFIPRTFNNELYTERNLNNVIEFILVNKIPFEVFVEGTRSRDGKLLLPKYGILKSLSSIYLKQRQEEKNHDFNLLFQPIAVTYERVYENDSFLKELKGDDKTQESLFGTVSVAASAFLLKKDNSVIFDNKGWNDNSERTLTGKIFVKFGDSFKISEFIDNQSEVEKEMPDGVNLKKLGFKILHEINKNSYIPEVSIIGTAIQAYESFTNKTVFPISELIPTLRIVVTALLRENEDSVTNSKILRDMLVLSDEKLTELVKDQIYSFFRYIKVNDKQDVIKVESTIELLYYKNLTIHLIIKRCLVMYILLLLNGCPNCNHRVVGKIFYILTGFLKNEFLFDYDENDRNELSFILNDLVDMQVISKTESSYSDSVYKVVDEDYVKLFANLAQPFLESYIVLISNILEMTKNLASSYAKKKQQHARDKIILDDDELKYPTTKGLLKYIIQESKKNQKFVSLESINKQYLVSDLYYLNNLQLVQIFKNKAKTKAFVQIMNLRDLNVLNDFLHQLLQLGTKKKNLLTNEVSVNYIIDITDKNFDRDYDDLRLASRL